MIRISLLFEQAVEFSVCVVLAVQSLPDILLREVLSLEPPQATLDCAHLGGGEQARQAAGGQDGGVSALHCAYQTRSHKEVCILGVIAVAAVPVAVAEEHFGK